MDNSVRTNVLSVLSVEWPLSAKEIHLRIQRNLSNPISYQGTHKTISSMLEQNIITKKGKSYQLNKDWIENLSKFSENLRERYSGKGNTPITKDFQGTTKWIFDDYTDAVLAWTKLFSSKILVGKNSAKGIALVRHAYCPLKFKFIDFTLLADMVKNNGDAYVVVQSDTPFDRWIQRLYLSAGVKGVKLGEKTNSEKDLMIHGEYILEITFSKETQERLDKIYSNTKHLGDLLKYYAKETITKNPDKVEVTITRKPELAALLLKQLIEKHFGEKSK